MSEWYSPNYQPRVGIPHRRKQGEEVWRVESAGRVQTCEVFDHTSAGAGFDVMLLIDREPVFSRRCANRAEADYVVKALHQDAARYS
ncbi:MAG: hypothetical protein AB7N65_16860 [Vicinamibacterales bacterium]